jgi:multidrug efflux system membrane fusion protein
MLRRALMSLPLVTCLAAACHPSPKGSAPDSKGLDGGQTTPGGAPVPVVVATVEPRDFPLYLDGLGTVAAYYSVTLRSRVDGELVKVDFEEGRPVRKGDLLAQIDPRPYEILLHQAEANLARDKALLQDNKLNYDRYVDLRKQDLIAQQQVDDQRAQVGQYEGTVKGDEAAVENAKLQIIYSRITSPIDGVTGVRQVDPGNIVHATDTNGIVVITQLDPIAVFVTLPEDDLAAISKQMALGGVTAQALSRDGTVDYGSGTVALIDNQINPATGTLRLKAIFPNPQHLLWPNQFVKVRVMLGVRKNAIAVASSVLQRGPQGPFVYLVEGDQTVEVRPVKPGPSQGDETLIESGLAPGDVVVAEGQYKLRPGSKISTQMPATTNTRPKKDAGPLTDP